MKTRRKEAVRCVLSNNNKKITIRCSHKKKKKDHGQNMLHGGKLAAAMLGVHWKTNDWI